MRIVHINLSPPGNGGIERLLVDFLRVGKSQGHDVEACVLGSLNAVSQDLIGEGYRITALNRSTQGFDWTLHARLAAFLRREKFDVVHIHGNPGVTFGVPAALLSGRWATVYTCHFSESKYPWWRHRLLGSLLDCTRAKVAVSSAARDVLVSKYHQSVDGVRIIYNGVDLERFTPRAGTNSEELTFGFCGVLRPEKQVPLLIRCFAEMLKTGVKARLSIVGDGVEMSRCRQTVAECGIEDRVIFHGLQKDIRPFVREMDVFCLPSSQEAMPVALLEAMALGCTPVASDVGGIAEVVEHESSGLLVPSGDEARWFEALCTVAHDPGQRRTFSQTARTRIETKFSLREMMSQYDALYQQIA
ncbi:glycosyltransferase [bacterium]|nr:glycosyltransferase [bacterium]